MSDRRVHDGRRFRALATSLTVALVGCGGARATCSTSALPELAEERDTAIGGLGRSLWDALATGEPWTVVLEDDELRAILYPEEATRYAVRRGDVRSRLREAAGRVPPMIAGASYLGICAQDSRDEPGRTSVGLMHRAWVISRALVAGRIGGGSRRIALWVDGTFVATNTGFRAIDLERIESPRWEHSDLEILACDVSDGL